MERAQGCLNTQKKFQNQWLKLKINLEDQLESIDTDFNPLENLDFTAIKSTQYQTQTDRKSEITYRLDMSKTVVYNSTAITKKYERTYDTNSNLILNACKLISNNKKKHNEYNNIIKKFYIDNDVLKDKYKNLNINEFTNWLVCYNI